MIVSKKKSADTICKVDPTMHKDLTVMDEFIVQEKEMVNNRVVKKSVRKMVDARDNFKDYRVSDFYMENLEAAGAVPTKTVQYYDGDIDKVLDYVNELNELNEE